MDRETRDRHLRDALRALPRARPSGDFTDRVLARAAPGSERARALPATLRWAVAATLAGTALAGVLAFPGAPPRAVERATRGPDSARIEALETERLRLAAELDEIRRLAASLREPAPMLYLGGDEEVDLVLDLDRLAQGRPGRAGATPAAYRGRRTH